MGKKITELSVTEKFLNLFNHLLEINDLDNKQSSLNLFVLPLENNSYYYTELVEALSNLLPRFVFSEHSCKSFESDISAYKKAKRKLIEYKKLKDDYYNEKLKDDEEYKKYKDGELGEYLLYCFLESHLKAPKILSKVELKTNSNVHIHGSDGVHLLKLSDVKYEIVFGESKMCNEIDDAIKTAFKSINEFRTREKDNIDDEIDLICNNLNKEFDEETEEILRDIIKPKRIMDSRFKKSNSFSIFLGFDICKHIESKDKDEEEYKNEINQAIISSIHSNKDLIKEQITTYKLEGYNFYIYALPFENLNVNRNSLCQQL